MSTKKREVNSTNAQIELLPEFKMIECRQQSNSSTSFIQRGCDFETIIPDGVELKNGESISVASCFLDTVTNDSGLIELENNDPDDANNCIISASFMYYLADIPTTNEGRYRGDSDVAPAGGAPGDLLPPIILSKTYVPTKNLDDFDGEFYVACSKEQKAGGDPAVKINGFRLELTEAFIRNKIPGTFQQNWINVTLIFTSMDGKTKHTQRVVLQREIHDNSASNEIVRSLITEGNILTVDQSFYVEYLRQCKAKGVKSQIVSYIPFPITSLNRNPQGVGGPADIKTEFTNYTLGDQPPINIDDCVLTTPYNGTDQHYRPIVNTITMNLPVTTYGADELAQRIGREFSKANQQGDDMQIAKANICANPFLKTSRQMRNELNDAGKNDEVHFVRASDGNFTFQLNTKRELTGGESPAEIANYNIGSSQFGLLYDDTTSKMNIDLMHSSFLDVSSRDGGGLPETRIYKNSNDKELIATAYSGIILTNLSPTSLWKDSFKFDIDSLCVSPREASKVLDTVNSIVPVFDIFNEKDNRLIAGQNITTELGSIDGCIVKKRSGASGGNVGATPPVQQTSANTQCFDIVAPQPNNTHFIDYFASIQQDHLGIFGKGQVTNNSYGITNSEDSGYYQIEVDINGVSTDMKGKDKYNNKIMSVISKYYSSTNYLSSYNEGSTEFYYKGKDPLKISKIHIRVLDPDGTLSTINNDNTIFLKLEKSK